MLKNKKRPLRQIVVAEFIFWLHTAILVAVIFAGLFVDWWVVVIIIAALRLQVRLLHGCILTILEDRERGYGRQVAYFKIAWRRFFGINLDKKGVRAASAGQILLALAVAGAAAFWHVRLHI